MVTTDVDLEHRLQLKEAGRLLSPPPASIDELLYILDQLEKLLSMVEQSPKNPMKEAYTPPMKALVDGNLLEHSNIDVKLSVAVCLCEITRITAPDAPYNDEVMKRVFQCIISSFDDLSDISSRSYAKRMSILETVSKVRSCVVMLDLECDDLIVRMFELLLNSVRDHHRGDAFSSMTNIMTVVFDESDIVSLEMLKPLLASIKNNSEGVLPVRRKLGEEVIRMSADKLRPYLKKAVAILGDSLVDYSPVLTSVCDGTPYLVEHNDESASVQPKVVDATSAIKSLEDAAQVINNGEMVTENKDVDDQQKPEGAVDHPSSNLTSKLNSKDPGTGNSGIVESNPDTTKSAKPFVSETVHGENRAEKSPEVAVSVENLLESEALNAASKSDSQKEEPLSKINITKGIRSKKKGSKKTDPSSTAALLTKVIEATSDPEMRSPKRVRKKTAKAEENKPSVTAGSDAESLKNLGKNVETNDSGPKPAKRSGKKVGGGSAAKKPKLSEKKASELKKRKQDDKKVEAGDSESSKLKEDDKKGNETNSDAKPLKPSRKRAQKKKAIAKPSEDLANKDEETDSDVTPLKLSENKEDKTDSDPKALNLSENKEDDKKGNETNSDAKPLKPSRKRAQKKKAIAKPSEDLANKDEETDSDVTPLKLSENKEDKTDSDPKALKLSENKDDDKKGNETNSDAKPLKPSRKRAQKKKAIAKPSEDLANKDEETDSDVTPLKLSENKEDKTDSDPKALNLSENKDDEETDSDNIPLLLTAKRAKKSISSVVNSSLKNKDGKKQESGKTIEVKDQTKSLSEDDDDDGMNVSLKSALKMVTKEKSKMKGALSTSSKRKRSVTKKKVTGIVEYDDNLVGEKIKVWWPRDKVYYEGVIESFDSAKKKHKVLYLDNEEEILNLKTQKWEIIKEFSTPSQVVAFDVQNTDVLPEIVAGSKGESKVTAEEVKEAESKEDEETKKDEKEEKPKKMYSRGRKVNNKKVTSSDGNVKETEAVDAAEKPESGKDPKIGSTSGSKKKKMN